MDKGKKNLMNQGDSDLTQIVIERYRTSEHFRGFVKKMVFQENREKGFLFDLKDAAELASMIVYNDQIRKKIISIDLELEKG